METHFDDAKGTSLVLPTKGFLQYTEFGDFKCQNTRKGFPGGAVVENLPANAGDTGSSPGLGRSHMLRSN